MDEAKSGSAECEYEKTVQEKPDHCHNAGGDDRSGGIFELFRKNIFVTAKKLRFYNGSKLAFTVPKGKQVTLKKLTLSKNTMYLQFQYGKKTGWLRVNNKDYNYESPYFEVVSRRLAG